MRRTQCDCQPIRAVQAHPQRPAHGTRRTRRILRLPPTSYNRQLDQQCRPHTMTAIWPTMLSQRGAQFDATGAVHFEPSPTSGATTLTPLLREASILVSGEDAESFLQGQLSNDIRQVSAAQ